MSFIPYTFYTDKLGSHYKDVFNLVDDELLSLTNDIIKNLNESKVQSTKGKNKYSNYIIEHIKADDELNFDRFKFTISAPGFSKNELDILFDENSDTTLKVKSKKENIFKQNIDFQHRFCSKKHRNINLDVKGVKAKLESGILTITIPTLKLKSCKETSICIE